MQLNQSINLYHPLLKQVRFEPLDIIRDHAILQQWLSQEYAKFWGMMSASKQQIINYYQALMASTNETAYLGYVNGQAQFLIELYSPGHHPIGEHISTTRDDLGLHILIAPADIPVHGYSKAIMHTVCRFIFSHLDAKRILVEPDRSNHKVHQLNLAVGIKHIKPIQLGAKSALLGVLTQHEFHQVTHQHDGLHRSNNGDCPSITELGKHITAQHWQHANLSTINKMLTEFSHERLIKPHLVADNNYSLHTPDGTKKYLFRAQRLPLDHLLIAPDTIQKYCDDELQQLDAMAFITEFSSQLGLQGERLATYLSELSSTLSAACYKLQKPSYSAVELALQSFQVVEVEMTHGHPSFIANNGRIGFSASDYHQYAPEAANTFKLIWLAAAKSNTEFHSIAGITYQQLLASQLDLSEQLQFAEQLIALGLDPECYYFLPVHPWQWQTKLVHLYTRELAEQKLVFLGLGCDHYLAQQSIRTLFNLTKPQNYYVKVALSILNMGFMRGLSAPYMAVTPAINEWVFDLICKDPSLVKLNFVPLREFATLGFSGSHYEHSALGDTPYKKMLAALWRDNPINLINNDETLATMASLLHQDTKGKSYVVAKIRASKLTPEGWISAYLKAYLIPLVHCFYAHKLVFMPHGENLIIRFKKHIPVGVFIKDIGEEVCVLNSEQKLPTSVKRIAVSMKKELELLSIFTDVFDCFFRYLIPLLETEKCLEATQFWRLVALEIKRYQAMHKELTKRFAQYDLFCDEFALSCLNRLQLANNKQMVNLSDPAASLQFAGTLTNPIARYKNYSIPQLEALAEPVYE